MSPALVVRLDPPCDHVEGMLEGLELVLPDVILLEGSEESLDKAILLGRVGRDDFFFQTMEAARLSQATALEDQALVDYSRERVATTQGLTVRLAPARRIRQTPWAQTPPSRFGSLRPRRKLRSPHSETTTSNSYP